MPGVSAGSGSGPSGTEPGCRSLPPANPATTIAEPASRGLCEAGLKAAPSGDCGPTCGLSLGRCPALGPLRRLARGAPRRLRPGPAFSCSWLPPGAAQQGSPLPRGEGYGGGGGAGTGAHAGPPSALRSAAGSPRTPRPNQAQPPPADSGRAEKCKVCVALRGAATLCGPKPCVNGEKRDVSPLPPKYYRTVWLRFPTEAAAGKAGPAAWLPAAASRGARSDQRNGSIYAPLSPPSPFSRSAAGSRRPRWLRGRSRAVLFRNSRQGG